MVMACKDNEVNEVKRLIAEGAELEFVFRFMDGVKLRSVSGACRLMSGEPDPCMFLPGHPLDRSVSQGAR